jgi:GTP-binding protein
VPILFTSARTGQRVNRALELILEVQEQRQRRISTHEVNDVLRSLVGRTKPPSFAGHSVRFLYGTQVATEPPTFVFWVNFPEGVTESYQRYLMNGFRAAWGFMGAPLVIRLRRREDTESRRPRQGRPHAPDEVEEDEVEVAYVRGDGPGGRADDDEEYDEEFDEADFGDEEDEA